MNNFSIKDKFFNESVSTQNIRHKGPINIYWKSIIAILLIAFFVFSIYYIDFGFSNNGLRLLGQNLKSFFSPSLQSQKYGTNLFTTSLKFLWTSIKVVFLGTIFGLIFSLLSSYLSNYKMNKKYVAIVAKIFVIFLRLVPELFFIYLFKISFDKTLAIAAIFSWFTWLWLHEYFSQIIENSNFTIFYHLLKAKRTKLKAFWIEILPQIKAKIINYVLYAFESNLRWSAILFEFGFLGIGLLIYPNETNINYSELLIPLLILTIFIFVLELINYGIKQIFFISKTKEPNLKKYNKNSAFKKTLAVLIILLIMILFAIGIYSVSKETIYFGQGFSYMHDFFAANWKAVNWSFSNGVAEMILQFACLLYLSMATLYLIAYAKLFIASKQLFKNKIVAIGKFENSLIRAIPTVSIFILISTLFVNFYAPFVIAFAIHGASSLSKNLDSSINKISQNKVNILINKGYNKFAIFKNFIMPNIKRDLITFLGFELEKLTRNFITYGLYGASKLGEATHLTRVKEISDIAPYLWIGFFIMALINLTTYTLRSNFIKKYKASLSALYQIKFVKH